MSSPRQKPACETVMAWLAKNLGANSLGVLTGTDAKALVASVHIVEMYAYGAHEEVLVAFFHVVAQMQRRSRYLAYHAIAHVMDWSDRDRVWSIAGLPVEALVNAPECLNAPSVERPVDEVGAAR